MKTEIKKKEFYLPQSTEGNRGSFEYVKEKLSKKSKKEIVEYSIKIALEFAKSMEILTVDIPIADEKDVNHLIGDVLLLDKNRSIIFLLRAFREGNPIDNKLINRWENFLLCYAIIYWNGYYYKAKSSREDFESIYKSIKDFNLESCNNLLVQYYMGLKNFSYHWKHLGDNAKKLFEVEKNKWLSAAFFWDKTVYFLYKYELDNGANYEIIRNIIFKKDSVSKDHIVARGLSWHSLGYENYEALPKDSDIKKKADLLWKEIEGVIHGIGNLALSTISYNSSNSNGLPNEHISTYKKSGLMHTAKQVETWKVSSEFASKINQRSEDILKFISEKIIDRNDIWQ